jgi:hypothetical protein
MPLQRRPQLMNDDRIAIEETALAVDVNARTRNDNNVMMRRMHLKSNGHEPACRSCRACTRSLHGQRAALLTIVWHTSSPTCFEEYSSGFQDVRGCSFIKIRNSYSHCFVLRPDADLEILTDANPHIPYHNPNLRVSLLLSYCSKLLSS